MSDEYNDGRYPGRCLVEYLLMGVNENLYIGWFKE